MKPLLLFPCNGNAIEALDCLGDAFSPLGFIDDSPQKQGNECFGLPVHSRDALRAWPEALVLAVPGGPETYRARRQAIESLGVAPERWATVIHPQACISPRAHVGVNVLVMAGVVVTSNAMIGSHVCILPNSVVHHDARVGDGSLVGANVTIAGHVIVESDCYIGSGSSILHGARIGSGSLVGLGSNVLASFPSDARIAGNPARILHGATAPATPCK